LSALKRIYHHHVTFFTTNSNEIALLKTSDQVI